MKFSQKMARFLCLFTLLILQSCLNKIVATVSRDTSSSSSSPNNSTTVTSSGLPLTFGSNGSALFNVNYFNFPGSEEHIYAIAEKNNSTFIAGYTDAYGTLDGLVLKYKSDGTLDTSFGHEGKVLLEAKNGNDDSLSGIAIDSNNKIIVAGKTIASSEDLFVARLNADGSYDRTFGTNGKIVVDIGASSADLITAIKIDSNGKILLAGYSNTSGTYDAMAFRLNSNGTLDTSFGSSGYFFQDLGASNDNIYSLDTDSSGNIYLGGVTNFYGGWQSIIIKLNSTGTVDNSFGTGGLVHFQAGSNTDYLSALKIDSQDRVVASGYSFVVATTSYDLFAVRLSNTGAFDNTFGTAGKTLVDISTHDTEYGYGLSLDSNDSVFITGTTFLTGDENAVVVKLTNAGVLDTTYNGTGYFFYDSGGVFNDYLHASIIDSSGNLLAAGDTDSTGSSDALLIKIKPTGIADTSFNSTGLIKTDVGTNSSDEFFGSTIDSNGKIIAVGDTKINGDYDLLIVRFNVDGTLDTSFGTNGKLTMDLSGNYQEYLSNVIVTSDNKIVAVGESNISGNFQPIFVKLNSNGTLDTSFGSGGISQPNMGLSPREIFPIGMLIDNNKFVISGYSSFRNEDGFIARFNSDGSLDTSFGTNGSTFIDVGTNTFDQFYHLVKDSSGNFYTVGNTSVNGDRDALIAKFDNSGNIDTAFGTSGLKIIDVNANSNDYLSRISIDNNKIYASGYSNKADDDFLVLKLDTNGVLDTNFNTTGIFTYDSGTHTTEELMAMEIDENGKVVVAGTTNQSGNYTPVVMRLNSNGAIDTSFATSGKLEFLPDNYSAGDIYNLNIYSTKIFAVGNDENSKVRTFITRINSDGTI